MLRDHVEIATILAISGLIVLVTYPSYGITNDEYLHVAYGETVIDWYKSLGEDTRALEDDRTYYYGALFDASTEIVCRIFPVDVYETKHLCNALLGLLGILAAYRIGDLLGGRTAGILAAVSLILAPRYYGHTFNNPKDIPFAVFYLWSVYNIIRALETFPRLSMSCAVWTGLAIGATLGIRVGGVFLFVYLGLFLGFAWLLFGKGQRPIAFPIKQIAAAITVAIVVMLLSWPMALVNPLYIPLEALTRFASFPESHWSFFDGEYINSLETPRSYLPTWLALTLPEHILLGLLLGLILIVADRKDIRLSRATLQLIFLGFAAVFPFAYAVATKPSLYDGMRHFLFIVPPLCILSGLAWAHGIKTVRSPVSSIIIGLAAVTFTIASVEAVRLHPNQVVYFNRLVAGTVDRAWLNYETDYWRHAQKQALRWIADHRAKTYGRPVRVASKFVYNQHQLPDGVELVDFRASPDYYVGSTRYDEHKVIPGEVIHVIRAREAAELAYVIRPDDAYVYEPFFTNSFWADLHRRPIYEREGQFEEHLGNTSAAARAYLKLARCYERLADHADQVTESEANLIARAREYQRRAVRLIPEQDAWTVARRYLDQGNHLAARDILIGLAEVYPGQTLYRETLLHTLDLTGESSLAEQLTGKR